MAYTQRNRLQRIIDIQTITLTYTNLGVSQERVFFDHIQPTYRISKRTFYNYLSTPAKRELGKLDAQPRQATLF